MIKPRVQIAELMAVIAIVALDVATVQALLTTATHSPAEAWSVILGALPMANILTAGLLVAHRRRSTPPILFGFELFGVFALINFIYVAVLLNGLLKLYLFVSFRPLASLAGNLFSLPFPVVSILGIYSFEVIMLLLPQLGFALLGGFLFPKFRAAEWPIQARD